MNTHAWIAAIVAGLGATVVAQNPPRAQTPLTMVIQDVTLIDGTGAQPTSAQPASVATKGTGIVLLGTGTPLPDPNAFGPATAITVGDRTFLVDAGAGVTRRMVAAGFPRTTDLAALFVTHLHTDHTLGYPDLIFTSWVMGRTTPIEAYGPRGLKRMTDHLLAAWSEDIDVRINGLEREGRVYGVNVHDVKPGVVYDRDGVRVTAIPVAHGNWKEAYGYRFDTSDRSIVVAGDTSPSEALVTAARGCDVLIHEVYAPKGALPEKRPGGELWPQYMKAFHTSALELGALAARIQPKLLVLHHVIMPDTTEAELVADIRKGGFAGHVVLGRDLEKY